MVLREIVIYFQHCRLRNALGEDKLEPEIYLTWWAVGSLRRPEHVPKSPLSPLHQRTIKLISVEWILITQSEGPTRITNVQVDCVLDMFKNISGTERYIHL